MRLGKALAGAVVAAMAAGGTVAAASAEARSLSWIEWVEARSWYYYTPLEGALYMAQCTGEGLSGVAEGRWADYECRNDVRLGRVVLLVPAEPA